MAATPKRGHDHDKSQAALPASPQISVVVVTWNGLHLLRGCLAALDQQTIPHELIIVDNGSTDGTAAWLSASVPRARCIALDCNRGFAGGNNVGIGAASGKLIVLINNDTLPAPDFLAELTAPFALDRRLGATAGVLVFAHRPDIIASAGIHVARDGVHRDLLACEPVATLPHAPVPVWGASGGAACYRREALSDVGLFPESFFAYLEDADLAWRLRLRGWQTLLAPGARILHIYSATGGEGSPFKQRLLARNRWFVLLRCVPGALLLQCLPAILLYDALAFGYALVQRHSSIIWGRMSAFASLRRLLRERRAILRSRTATVAELAHWLEVPPGPQETLLAARTLQQILSTRA